MKVKQLNGNIDATVRRTAYKQHDEPMKTLNPHDYRFLKRGFISFVMVVACTLIGASYTASNNDYVNLEREQDELMGHIPLNSEVLERELPPKSLEELETEIDF